MGIILNTLPSTGISYFTHPRFLLSGDCDDFVLDDGAYFEATLYVDKALHIDGSIYTFTWNGISIALTVAAIVALADYGSKVSTSADNFGSGSLANIDIATDFEIVLTYSDVYYCLYEFKARRKGSAYDLTIVNDNGSCFWAALDAGADLDLNNDLSILCNVYKKRLTNWDLQGALKSALVYSEAGDDEFAFELSEFLAKCLSPEIIKYDDFSNYGYFFGATKSFAQFKLHLSQNTGWLGNINLTPFYILRGGLTKRDHLLLSEDPFILYFDNTCFQLINYVKAETDLFKYAAPNQKLYTSFYFYEDRSNCELQINIYDSTGASGLDVLNPTAFFSSYPLKFTLQYGYNEIGIAAIAAGLSLADVASWEIILYNNDSGRGDIIDKRILVSNDYRELFFVFENSLGGWQTIRTLGEHEYGVEIDKAEFEKSIPFYDLINQDFMLAETYSHNFKGEFFSGWLDLNDVYNFLDFLNSEVIYRQDDDIEAMTPVKIIKGSWTIFKKSNNGVNQFGFTVRYVETTSDKHVTNLIEA
jgi:hypothetical protein